MDGSTKTTATDLPRDIPQAGAVFRFFIDSWEIDAGGPRPVVGRVLGSYHVAFWPADPQDFAGRAALDKDTDVGALPTHVVVPPDIRGGRHRGHLHTQWHVTPSEGPLYKAEPLFGLVVRTQIISVNRRQGTEPGPGASLAAGPRDHASTRGEGRGLGLR